MSRMFFSFDINFPDTDSLEMKGLPIPSIDYLAFETKDRIISVSFNEDSTFEIKNGKCSGRFKGLDVHVLDTDKDEMVHNYDNISAEDFKLLESSAPYEIGLFVDNLSFKNALKATNVEILLENNDKCLSFKEEKIDIISYGKESEIEIDNESKDDLEMEM